jgi:uncharacterized membrane protein YgdD (TMEM256/DUF423 family)
VYARHLAHGRGDGPGRRAGSPLWLGPESGRPRHVVDELIPGGGRRLRQNIMEKSMERFFGVAGAVAAMIGVILGAFGAHGLRGRLSPTDMEIFDTGVRYHLYHALGLFAVAWAASRWPSGATTLAGWSMIVGIVIFSGSLYTLVLTGQRWLGAVTPIGGLALIAGWAALAWAMLRS